MTEITVPTKYRDCIIAPRKDGFDVITPQGWFVTRTQQSAKWWATVQQTFNKGVKK